MPAEQFVEQPGVEAAALLRLRPRIARAGAVIHGAESAAAEASDAQATQAALDALFER